MQIIIVSPSGNYYGSEQVLCDYVTASAITPLIYVNNNGLLKEKLIALGKAVSVFRNVPVLYAKISWKCILGAVSVVYVNEAGHSRYINWLSKWFPAVKFVLHVRIVEDTGRHRWPRQLPGNLTLISVSRYIQQLMPLPSVLVYDPYPFNHNRDRRVSPLLIFRVGVIGRVCISKGIDRILELLQIISDANLQDTIIINFFGDVDADLNQNGTLRKLKAYKNVVLHGFVDDKMVIYNQIDCVLHAAQNEPLGRIFLEALDLGVPFVGIRYGGIAEIGTLTGTEAWLVDGDKNSHALFRKLIQIQQNYSECTAKIELAKSKAREIFDLNRYAKEIDEILMNYE